MSDRKIISEAEAITLMRNQGVPFNHTAVRCVKCGCIQSRALLGQYMSGDDAERCIGFSCVGRFTPLVGCDWTLGGLFQIHKLEIIDEKGDHFPYFEFATPEEARALMQTLEGVKA